MKKTYLKSNLLYLILILILIPFINLSAVDKNLSKCNSILQRYLLDNNIINGNYDLLNKAPNIACLIKIKNNSAIQELKSKGVIINTIAGNIISARFPANIISDITAMNNIEGIEMGPKGKFHCDTAKVHIGADKLISGQNITRKKFTGKGVLVGIIDSGIDFYHKDFRNLDDTTKSRILYIWSQNQTEGNKPDGFNYGVEYTREEIENEIDGSPEGFVLESDANEGHGTHVTGIAAGNRGMAPESDIIFVHLDVSKEDAFTTLALDAFNYILKKADELGRPVVINGSFGIEIGLPHDGSDFLSEGISNLIDEKEGRIFCASAGNSGQDYIHFGEKDMNNDSIWTYMNCSVYSSANYFYCYNKDKKNIELCLELDSIDEYNNIIPLAKSKWYNIDEIVTISVESDYIPLTKDSPTNDTLAYFHTPLYTTYFKTKLFEMTLNFKCDQFSYKNIYKLYVRGTGSFHSWCEDYSRFIHLDFGELPIDDYYVSVDNEYMIGSPAAGDKVITVGAYGNRYSFLYTNGEEAPEYIRATPGSLAQFSSIGPRSDEVMKPDIVAPGQNVISAVPHDAFKDDYETSEDGTYIANSGTSMSCPAVTGGIALLFEKDPTLNYDKIIKMIRDYAETDEFTSSAGSLPNTSWGWGKFNVNRIIENWFNNVIDNNTIIGKFEYYPNPAYDRINLIVNNNEYSNGRIIITNLLGITEIDKEITLDNGDNRININIKDLNPGVHFINVIIGNEQHKGKIIKTNI